MRLVSVVRDVVEEEIVGDIDEKDEEITGNESRGQPKAPSELQLNKFGADVPAIPQRTGGIRACCGRRQNNDEAR